MSNPPDRRSLSEAAANFAKGDSSALKRDVAGEEKTSLRDRLKAPDREPIVRFTLDLTEALHTRLSRVAADLKCSKADLVREAVIEALNTIEGSK
jgi:hypothetical protein